MRTGCIEQCQEALRDLAAGKCNAMAIYCLESLDDPTPARTPIAELLNAGYEVRIPYRTTPIIKSPGRK